MTFSPSEVYGILYPEGFYPIHTPYAPGVPPSPYRTMKPWQDPFPSDHFSNVPIGSGLTYLSTSDAKHLAIVGCTANLNYNNWTDPIYLATGSDSSFTVEHHDYLPSGWNSVNNTTLGTASGVGPLSNDNAVHANIRVPTQGSAGSANWATWQSTSNTDRKVHVVQSDGRTAIEMHKFYRTTTSGLIYVTNYAENDIVSGYGMTAGAIASGISAMVGYVRAWEITAILSGDKYAIKHALKIGLSNAMLASGPIWPARTQDSDSSSYTGTVPYGTHVSLPTSVNLETMTISGSSLTTLQKAFLYALQRWGAYVLIRAGSNNVMTFGVEPRSPLLNSTQANEIKAGLNAAIPLLRVSSNSSSVGTLGANRQPLAGASVIAGGGTRITAGQSLSDINNSTGLKLPIDPNSANWI